MDVVQSLTKEPRGSFAKKTSAGLEGWQPCSPGWTYNPNQQSLHVINCKRRTCENCGKFWAHKWRRALREKTEYDHYFNKKTENLALTLTTSSDAGYKRVKAAFRYFFELLRKKYPKLKYFCAVEYNQAHTLPHFHFVLDGYSFIPHNHIRECWIKAQTRAKFESNAWILRVEKIKGAIEQYFTKYITKLSGGKDEIPRKENWQGRYVRYSQKSYTKKGELVRDGFFPAQIPVMAMHAKFARALDQADGLDRLYHYTGKQSSFQGLPYWMEEIDREERITLNLVRAPWQPWRDKSRASPLTAQSSFDLTSQFKSDLPKLDPKVPELTAWGLGTIDLLKLD